MWNISKHELINNSNQSLSYLITQLSPSSCRDMLRGCQLENSPATSTLVAPFSPRQ